MTSSVTRLESDNVTLQSYSYFTVDKHEQKKHRLLYICITSYDNGFNTKEPYFLHVGL